MGRIHKFLTRSLGSDAGNTDPVELSRWVSDRKGSPGDLTSFQLEQRLAPQEEAGIDRPCAGGSFYLGRIMECLRGVEGLSITGELDIDWSPVAADTGEFKPGTWFALPAPGEIGLVDRYYGDPEEAGLAIRTVYRRFLRAMRDAGAGGHVLICGTAEEGDLEMLAGRKVFFFPADRTPDSLARLLEYQREVPVAAGDIPLFARDMIERFDVSRVILLDPDPRAIADVLLGVDPDRFDTGGYCREKCSEYWQKLKELSVYHR